MSLAQMHPQDVTAEIRKRFRSVAAFERKFGLPEKSVTDLLRGRKSGRVKRAIEDVISKPISAFPLSEDSDDSQTDALAHRLNAGAR